MYGILNIIIFLFIFFVGQNTTSDATRRLQICWREKNFTIPCRAYG